MANEKIVIFHHDERGAAVHWSEMGELVRCKDCKHYWKNSKYKSNMEDMEDVAMCLASPSDDAFCSDGERKDDE